MAGSASAQADPLVGVLLGKDYRVLEQIGVGGMAVVYLVEHQTLLKKFAAKVLSADHASSAEARARFTQEAHAASQLDHENIVSISDFGITPDQRPFFVMEMLRGKTLDVRLEEGPMTLEEVVAVSVPVARALAHAHAEGIIHRDVKPENVFLVQRSQGRWGVKVLDFGIAKVHGLNDRMTKTGQALGSPMFMAPEACKGEDVDQRTDVYSFGILLYLMLAGRVPFADENLLKVLQMQVSAPLPLPSSYNPNLPPSLEAVIIQALAKDPNDRYPTMEALLFDLEAALPEGSDALLIQAQFGTSNTPFPGSLEHIRHSQRMQRVSGGYNAATSGQYNAATSGQYKAATSGQYVASSSSGGMRLPAAPEAAPLPTAPRSSGSKAVKVLGVIAVLAVLGVGGAIAWTKYQESQAEETPPVVANAANPTTAPAPTPPPPEPAPTEPTTPRVVGPAHSTEPEQPPVPVKEEPVKTEEPPVKEEPVKEEPAKTAANKKPQNAQKAPPVKTAPPPPKKVEVAAKPTTETPKPAGSGSSTVVTTATTTKEPPKEQPKVEPPPASPPPDAAPKVEPKPAVTPPPVVNMGSLDAKPTIGGLDVNGPLPSSVVRRSVERAMPALRTCYQTAAKAQKSTPAVSMSIKFEVDESSAARNVSASGAAFGSLASCAKNAIGRLQTQQAPDVGTAHVVLQLKFTPI